MLCLYSNDNNNNNYYYIIIIIIIIIVGLGGLRLTCLPRDPRFTGSNAAEVNGFFSGCKNPEQKSSRMDFKLGVPSLRFQAR